MNYATLASEEQIKKTSEALEQNGFSVIVVENGAEAKKKALELLPPGGDVLTMTSETLITTGIADAINNSKNFTSVREQLNTLNRETEGRKMQEIGAAPTSTIGSVHAVTEDGKVVVASNTGSQLPAYAYGADQVIWVVGTQKIVKDLDDAMKRINEYVLPLESVRAHKAYGVPGSFVSKLLIFNREPNPKRITILLVKEQLGY